MNGLQANACRGNSLIENKAVVIFGGIFGVGFFGFLDWMTGPELALSIMYMAPVGFCAWFGGRTIGLAMAFLAAVVWTYLDIAEGRPYSSQWIPFWNGGARLGIFAMTAVLLNTIRKLTDNLQELVALRTAALQAEIANRKEVEKVATEIQSREQQRLGAELHDQLAGHLAGVAFMAKAISESLSRKEMPEGPEAQQLVGFLNQSLRQLRTFCRMLAPVDSGNLEPSLVRLGAEVETAFGITCAIQAAKNLPQLDLPRARLLYGIAQETVRRAIEKRMARVIEITLTEEGSNLKMVICDDGETEPTIPAPDEQELGVRIMRYRADILGGEVTVEQNVRGSRVTCVVPVDKNFPAVPFPPMS